ncbi:MAG: tetratricopeptide repeat protein [Bacteroidia bacterium]|nr:tetratricopeptide repeat protein [Bacteroidia bacterium]
MKGLAFAFIVLLAFLPTTQGFEKANELYYQKKYPEAISAYKKLMEKYPEDAAELQFNLAQCYLKIDSGEVALSLLHNAEKTENPVTKGKVFNSIGYLLIQKDKKKDAIEQFRKALEADPSNETARYNYELLLKQLKNQPEEEKEPEEEEEDDSMSAREYRDKFNFYSNTVNTEGLPTLHQYDSIPIDKAKEMLEALKSEEIKFLQQLRKSRKDPDNKKGQNSEW